LNIKATISSQREIAAGIFLLRLKAPRLAQAAKPGQFVMLKVSHAADPPLARPFSVAGAEGSDLLILYKVLGKGTKLLSQAPPGWALRMWGPLGHWFDLSVDNPVLVAGGMGIAPMGFVAQKLKERKTPFGAVYGARTGSELLVSRASRGWELMTDDGSLWRKGQVTDALVSRLPIAGGLMTCGPLPMLKAVARMCQKAGVPCQVSLEAPMACGIGACMGCVMPKAGGGHIKVCQDGPVMDASRIDWEQI
jgi:dihydroorotate dehydrogenase electron transfer subunit